MASVQMVAQQLHENTSKSQASEIVGVFSEHKGQENSEIKRTKSLTAKGCVALV